MRVTWKKYLGKRVRGFWEGKKRGKEASKNENRMIGEQGRVVFKYQYEILERLVDLPTPLTPGVSNRGRRYEGLKNIGQCVGVPLRKGLDRIGTGVPVRSKRSYNTLEMGLEYLGK